MSDGQLFQPRYDTKVAQAAAVKGQAVKLGTGDKQVTPVTADTDLVHGFVALQDVRINDDCNVYREGGEATALAGGAITKGALVKVTATGRVIVTTTANDQAVGYAIEAAANNELVRIFFTRIKV